MEELFNEFVNEHLFKLSVGVGVAYAGVLIAMGHWLLVPRRAGL